MDNISKLVQGIVRGRGVISDVTVGYGEHKRLETSRKGATDKAGSRLV